MNIVETNHFLDRWRQRVGRYRPRVHTLILRSIERKQNRVQDREDRGMMIPITWKKKPLWIVGVGEEHDADVEKNEDTFILRSVLTEEQARRMGWCGNYESPRRKQDFHL